MPVTPLASSRRPDLPIVRTSPGIGPIVILLGLLVVPVGLALSIDDSTYDTWGAFIWGPFLLALAFPLCRWLARRTGEPEAAGFFFGAAALKIVVGSTSRYFMVDSLYGAGDSLGYDRAASALAEPFRRGVFEDLGEVTGTRFIELLAGMVQAVIGETLVGTFLVFSTFGFVGTCLLYLAFCEALPDGDHVLYRRLIFLTPTMWFWPSSIGKEAFLMLCVGLVALGLVRMLDGRLAGALLAALGLWGAVVVRPHIALMLLIGALAALPPALRQRSSVRARPTPGRRLGRVVLPLTVVVLVPLMFAAVEQFFHIEDLNLESVSDVRAEVVRRTAQGGSEFTAPDPNNPVGLVIGFVTVALRPFPWEADGLQIVASLESVGLAAILGLAILRRRQRLVAALWERLPRFAIAYVLAFAWAFSAVANFGILARQRSLMLPFLFVLVASVRRRPREVEPQPSLAPVGVRGAR